jgi:hypothetical protein
MEKRNESGINTDETPVHDNRVSARVGFLKSGGKGTKRRYQGNREVRGT